MRNAIPRLEGRTPDDGSIINMRIGRDVVMNDVRIGLVGLDTSHVLAFARLFNGDTGTECIPGARAVAGYPGGSPDFEYSRSRVAGFTEELRSKYGVAIRDSVEAVADEVDVICITALDGRVHLPLLRQVAKFRKPVFIDKPFAVSLADAHAMVELAQEKHFPLMSCSSLRYVDVIRQAIGEDRSTIVGVDAYSPAAEEPTQPGLFWYGVHGMEVVVTAMGTGCREVRTVLTDCTSAVTMRWDDGRIATLRGRRDGFGSYGITVHRKDDTRSADLAQSSRHYIAGLAEVIVGGLAKGESPVPHEEMLEIVRIIEAANQSRETGQPVILRA